ncbi:PREDICTED: leucine-rich repeat extensin-like protein 5 [Brassica oleracea var. oleracea]|uniref:leucine-rich repeat extensin-like protein 5 n=1 Tax=Brassica oleracea var. oleracea TaxID=109376 RepID=UPI0006A6E27C|nr:PREDICTED: leucine-rich repeat extensin-like protein 5 [Brassica oleracea var. oleracea]
MDPSLPPPFTAFPPFTNSNPFPPPQHPFYGGAVNSSAVARPNNNQFFQPSPPVPSHPSVNHPHYSEVSDALSHEENSSLPRGGRLGCQPFTCSNGNESNSN